MPATRFNRFCPEAIGNCFNQNVKSAGIKCRWIFIAVIVAGGRGEPEDEHSAKETTRTTSKELDETFFFI